MKNKIIFFGLFLLLIFFINVENIGAAPDFTGGIGSGSASMGSSEYCNDQSGCVHNEKGVRVTLVDKNGEIIPGTHFVDYWNNIPSGASELTNSTFKSQYINGQQITLSLSPYSALTTRNTANIGGLFWSDTTGFHDQHDKVERLISAMDVTTKESCKNTMPGLFNDLGWNNVCEELFTGETCKDTMKNAYILLEPLFYINFKKNNIVVTGTEYTYLIYAYGDGVNWIQRQKGGIVYNLAGAAGYGNALVGMYLAVLDNNDDRDYEFNANGYKYRVWTETGALRYSDYYEWVHTAAFGRGDKSHYPAGSSMQLVWLGKILGDKCKNEKCCVPCNPDDKECIEKAGKNYHPKDPYCCDEQIVQNEDGVCDKDYWTEHNIDEVCPPKECDPTKEDCCEDPIWQANNPDLYELYCTPGEDKCEKIPTLTDPEIDVVDCDEDNTNNISHFRDPVFNSENGQFKEFNSIEKIVAAVKSNNGKLPDEWLEKIATEDEDNTFAAIVYGNNAGDERYTTEVNKFCKIYCQEIFEVELPDNYPYVNAGRYFKWTIKDSKNDISKASAAKLCAMDVDLDKAIDSYLYISQAAALALTNEMNFKFNGHTGVGDVSGGNPYASCGGPGVSTTGDNSFYNDYVAIVSLGGDKDGVPKVTSDNVYSQGYRQNDKDKGEPSDCPRLVCGDDGSCQTYYDNPRYYPIKLYSNLEESSEGLYSNGVIYKWTNFEKDTEGKSAGYSCTAPTSVTDYREMGPTPNGTDGTDDVTINPAVVSKKDDNGDRKNGISPKKWCEQTFKDYNTYVKGPGDASAKETTGFSSMIYSLYNDMKQCNDIGEALMDNVSSYLDIDMGLELTYQTLFNEHKYSTDDETIVSELTEDDKYHNSACFYHEKECEIDLDGDGRNDTPFYMDKSSSLMQKGGEDKILACDNIVDNWGVSQLESWNVNTVENPNVQYALAYNPKKLQMLSICKGNVDNGTFESGDCNKISKEDYLANSLNDREYDPNVYKFYNDKISYWSTAYIGFMSASELFQLNEEINACICKDGTVQDLEDGDCTCVKEVSYKNFLNEYGDFNNYQKLPEGTLTIEFMNPTGLYPISLRYWHIGSIDEDGNGHFDQFLDDYSGGKCTELDGCMYGDPNGVCRIVVKNKIIASPDDEGDCEDPPCPKVDPDDTGKCVPGPCPIPTPIRDCAVEVCDKINDLNLVYRVIDLDNPFPGTDADDESDSRPTVNWKGYEELITDNRGVKGNAIYSSNVEPLYSITLTPSLIKEIRRFNSAEGFGAGYTSSVMYPPGPAEPGGGYSLFLNRFLQGKIAVNIVKDEKDRFSDILEMGDMVK